MEWAAALEMCKWKGTVPVVRGRIMISIVYIYIDIDIDIDR